MPRITIISIVANKYKQPVIVNQMLSPVVYIFAEERLYFLKGMVTRDLMNGWQASA